MSKHIGTVIQVMGPVLDIRFPDGQLPALLSAIEVPNGGATIVAEVAQTLSGHGANIATMQLYRDRRGGLAVMVIECDHPLSSGLLTRVSELDGVVRCTYLDMEGA